MNSRGLETCPSKYWSLRDQVVAMKSLAVVTQGFGKKTQDIEESMRS